MTADLGGYRNDIDDHGFNLLREFQLLAFASASFKIDRAVQTS